MVWTQWLSSNRVTQMLRGPAFTAGLQKALPLLFILSLGSLAMRKASGHHEDTCHGEAHVVRNGGSGQQPGRNWSLLMATCMSSEWVLRSQSGLQVVVTMANIIAATSGEALSSAHLVPNFDSQKLWETVRLVNTCYLKHITLGGILLYYWYLIQWPTMLSQCKKVSQRIRWEFFMFW